MKQPHAAAIINEEEDLGEFDLDQNQNSRRTLLYDNGSSTIGPSIKRLQGEYRDVFFAVLFIASQLVVIILGFSSGIKALILSSPDEIIVNSDHTTQTIHNDKQFSRLSLLGGILLLSGCSVLISIAVVSLLCKYANQIATISIISTFATLGISGISLFVSGSILGGAMLFGIAVGAFAIYYFWIRQRLIFASAVLQIASEAIAHMTLFFYVSMLVCAGGCLSLLWLLALFGAATNESARMYEGTCTSYEYKGTYVISARTALTCTGDSLCHACVCDGSIVSALSPCYVPTLYVAPFIGLLVAFYWGTNTMSNIVHCGACKATALWYQSSEEISEVKIAAAFRKALTVNLGSVALGSLLVTIIQVARSVCKYITMCHSSLDRTTSVRGGLAGRVQGFVLSCMNAALTALDKAVRYFNRYAFVYVSLFDMTFMDASKAVVGLFANRGWTAIINDDIIETLLFFAEVAVGVVVLLLGFVYSRAVQLNSTDSLILALAGFFIGMLVCSTATRAVISACCTIYVMYCEDSHGLADTHPDASILLNAAWAELRQPREDHVLGGRVDDVTESAASFTSPQYVRKPNLPPAPPSIAAPIAAYRADPTDPPAGFRLGVKLPGMTEAHISRPFTVADEENGDDDDDDEGSVLNIAPMRGLK